MTVYVHTTTPERDTVVVPSCCFLFFSFPFLDLVAVFSIQWLLRQSVGLAAAAAAANAAPLSDLFCTHTEWMDDWIPSQKLLRDGLTRTGKRTALALKMDGTKRNGGVDE